MHSPILKLKKKHTTTLKLSPTSLEAPFGLQQLTPKMTRLTRTAGLDALEKSSVQSPVQVASSTLVFNAQEWHMALVGKGPGRAGGP
jgi:hypothetical protein